MILGRCRHRLTIFLLMGSVSSLVVRKQVDRLLYLWVAMNRILLILPLTPQKRRGCSLKQVAMVGRSWRVWVQLR